MTRFSSSLIGFFFAFFSLFRYPSDCLTAPAEQLGINLTPWSAEEQRLLEQALKTYPASVTDRWDRIAEAIPNRSKKECMKRYKVSGPNRERVCVREKRGARAVGSSARANLFTPP